MTNLWGGCHHAAVGTGLVHLLSRRSMPHNGCCIRHPWSAMRDRWFAFLVLVDVVAYFLAVFAPSQYACSLHLAAPSVVAGFHVDGTLLVLPFASFLLLVP